MLDEFDKQYDSKSTIKDEFSSNYDNSPQSKNIVSQTTDEFSQENDKTSIWGKTWEGMKSSAPAKIFNTITQTGGKLISKYTPEPVKTGLGKVLMPVVGFNKVDLGGDFEKKLGELSFDLLASFAGDATSYVGLGVVKKLGLVAKDIKKAQAVAKEMLAAKGLLKTSSEKWYHGGQKGITTGGDGMVTRYKSEAERYAKMQPDGVVYEVHPEDVIPAKPSDMKGEIVGDYTKVGFMKNNARLTPISVVESPTPKPYNIRVTSGESIPSSSLFHETKGVSDLLATGNATGLNVATDKTLALGQSGKGVVFELDAEKVLGDRGYLEKIKKPGTMFVGQKEFRILGGYTGQSKVKSITVKPGTTLSKVDKLILKRQFVESTLEDGSKYYTPKEISPPTQPIKKAIDVTKVAETPTTKTVTESDIVSQIQKITPNKLTLMNLQRKGIQRVTEEADNASSGIVKDYVYHPLVNAIENRYKEAVTNKQKIKQVADTLIKDLRSGNINTAGISKKVREFEEGVYVPTNPKEAEALTKANNEFRVLYDDLFARQNKALEPTGKKIIYRQHYHRHAQEIKSLEDTFGSLGEVPDEVFNKWNKPEAFLRGQEKTRLADTASEELLGAFEAMDSYIDLSAKTIHYTPEMIKLRSLAKALNSGGVKNPFAHVFNKTADSLAEIRTETEKHLLVKAWDRLTNRMIRNAITFKLSSAINQFASYPQMAALSGNPIKSLLEIGKQTLRTTGNIPKNIYEFAAKPINKAHSEEVLKLVNNPTFKGAADFLPSQQLNIMMLSDLNKEKILFEGAGASKGKVGEILNEVGGSMMQTTNNLMLRAAYNTGVSQYLKKVGKTLKEAIENPELGEAARKAGDFLVSHSQGEYIKQLKPLILQHMVGKNIIPLGTYVVNNLNSITHDLPMLVREAARLGKSPSFAASKYVGILLGTTIATNYAYKKAGVRSPISPTDYLPGQPPARFQSSTPVGMVNAPKDIYIEATEGQRSKAAVLLEKFVKDAIFKYMLPGGGSQLESLIMRGEAITPTRKKGQKTPKTKVKKLFEKTSKNIIDTPGKIEKSIKRMFK